MGTIETIILIVIASGVLIALCSAIFKKKKKEKTKPKENKEAKIEPVYKKEVKEEETQKTEKQEEKPKKDEGFKIIKKESKLKINKKALKADSRNPSITKVFVNGKKVDEEPLKDINKIETDIADEKRDFSSIKTKEDVGRFGVREPELKDPRGPSQGMPNRSPFLTDRSNFASHLNVSEDNNLSGVVGTGIKNAVERSESQGKDIDEKTDELIDKIKMDFLGDKFGMDPRSFLSHGSRESGERKTPKEKLKDIDAETLIIADAIAKRKGKKE